MLQLSDEDVISISQWVHRSGATSNLLPEAVRRILSEESAARRRLFHPVERHLVVLEAMFLVRNGAEASGRAADSAAVALHRNPTVLELAELGLLCVVTTSDDFPDGLWRITEDGVEVYLSHAPKIPINPDETADRTAVGSRRARRKTDRPGLSCHQVQCPSAGFIQSDRTLCESCGGELR